VKIFDNPHVQTLYATYAPHPSLAMVRERFERPDGDFVDCDWAVSMPSKDHQKPIAVLFHGLTGSSKSPYMLRSMLHLREAGFDAVAMHFRGCSGEPNRLPRSYHSGDTQDAIAWLRHLRQLYRGRAIVAAGFSLGGNMLLKLLAEADVSALPDAAAAVSAPMDLALSAERIDRGISRLYQRHLLTTLRAQLDAKYDRFDMEALIGLPREKLGKLATFRAFDDAYTAPIHGFDGVDDYYARCSAKPLLGRIGTPTLIVHAKDDPFTGDGVIPRRSELSASIECAIRKHGGHLGFVEGSFLRPRFWLYEGITEFFRSKIGL